jgi:hypothetical protein
MEEAVEMLVSGSVEELVRFPSFGVWVSTTASILLNTSIVNSALQRLFID